MNVSTKMNYMGFETKESKKSGKNYLLVSMMEKVNESQTQTFKFYVSAESLSMVTLVGQLRLFEEVGVKLNITSYNGEAKIDLEKIERLQNK